MSFQRRNLILTDLISKCNEFIFILDEFWKEKTYSDEMQSSMAKSPFSFLCNINGYIHCSLYAFFSPAFPFSLFSFSTFGWNDITYWFASFTLMVTRSQGKLFDTLCPNIIIIIHLFPSPFVETTSPTSHYIKVQSIDISSFDPLS